ncbi:dihydrofolate reductase family protein [Natrinema sp. HArc-T2]|uniref:dihydrofolate reductase family protein n=1 Tax=Natrinema sp. HArc-T2 TaxID=3242701 RepID=UPI00359E66E8
MSAGRVTLYIATSVDGYIADLEGGVDLLEEFQSESDGNEDEEGFREFFASIDCLVMGATTYEQVLGFGEWPYGDKPTYVFTQRVLSPATEAVEFVDREVAELSTELKKQHDHIWLVGGAQLAQTFLRERQIDALRLSQIPVLLGDGISLFAGEYDRQKLQLIDISVHDSGILEQHYEILGINSSR